MKKVATYIFLGIFFLNITSCDFLRRVAGRPTSDVIAVKASELALRQKAVEDSLKLAREIEAKRLAQEQAAARIAAAGVKSSKVFSFGDPVVALESRYNLIIGVYRTDAIARQQVAQARSAGFSTSTILFRGGVQAVALAMSDDLAVIADAVEQGRKLGICPKDAWIYVKE